MAEADCRPQINACVSRYARLGTDGVPLPGANNLYVSDALVSLAFSPVYTDGDEIDEKNACGATKVYFRQPDTFKRGDVEITLITPDPFLSEFLSGGDVLDEAGIPKGFAAPPLGAITGAGISVELWTNRIDDGDLDQSFAYAHWVYPKIKNLRVGNHSHEAGALKPVFSGQAYENVNWFDGPTGDWPALSDRIYQWLPTNVVPTPTCAYINLAAS
jgi:hypothetical protein